MYKAIFWNGLACAVLVLVAGSESPGASILTNFTGDTLAEETALNGFGLQPPDTDGCVGLDHYVQFTNGQFSVYNKSDGSTATAKITDTQFWLNAGISSSTLAAGLSDTRILFDQASQRWIATEITTPNTGNLVLVARSTDSDPTHGFSAVSYVGDSGFADYPTLGVNATGVFIGSNNFTSSVGNFSGVSITTIPKADLLAATPTAVNHTTFKDTQAAIGFTLQGATDFGPSNGHGSILGVNASFYSQLNRTDINNVSGPGAATLSTTTTIATQATNGTNRQHQPNGTQTLDGGDYRIGGMVYKVGSLIYAAHSLTISGHDAIRWDVLNESTNTVVQEGTISDPNFDYTYPSIAVTSAGAVIGFSRAGAAADGVGPGFISAFAVVATNSNGTLTFGAPILLKAGLANYTGSRWGDFSATSSDPNDPTIFWTTQEFAGIGNNWETQVTELVIPEPRAAQLLALAGVGLFIRRRPVSRVR